MDDRELDGEPRPEAIARRADGRPPSERTSDTPDEQARVILEESEVRIAEAAAKSDPLSDESAQLCGATIAHQDGAEGACTLLKGHLGGHTGLPANSEE